MDIINDESLIKFRVDYIVLKKNGFIVSLLNFKITCPHYILNAALK